MKSKKQFDPEELTFFGEPFTALAGSGTAVAKKPVGIEVVVCAVSLDQRSVAVRHHSLATFLDRPTVVHYHRFRRLGRSALREAEQAVRDWITNLASLADMEVTEDE